MKQKENLAPIFPRSAGPTPKIERLRGGREIRSAERRENELEKKSWSYPRALARARDNRRAESEKKTAER